MRYLVLFFVCLGLMFTGFQQTTTVEAAPGVALADLLRIFQGIDDGDGSEVLLSVSDLDGDDTADILWRETNFGFCGNSDEGQIKGTATLSGNDLTSTDAELTCFNSSNVICFGHTGAHCTLELDPFVLTWNEDNNALWNDEGGNTIVLHRIK